MSLAPDTLPSFTGALADALSRVTEAAAIAAAGLVGHGDEIHADAAATRAMAEALSHTEVNGRIVIGEGEPGSALVAGTAVGTGWGLPMDLAVDPLEGSTQAAKSQPEALSVLVCAHRDGLLRVPDVYMEKLAVGPGYPSDLLDLDAPPGEIVARIARHKGTPVHEVTACVLDRPRHRDLITALRTAGARVALISDGDVVGVINTALPDTGIDVYLGHGSAPAGVLAACALKCVGGQMLGRLVARNDDERRKVARADLGAPGQTFGLEGLCAGETIFCATGVTPGGLLAGVRLMPGRVVTETLVMTSADGRVRRIHSSVPR
jgi:fructose-1,6-bisphosphatase II / sedoheptulose-1,7-bisphosphatase